MNRIFKYYKNRKGITLVLMAFMLAVLLMLAGLAIDIAYMYYVKNQLQVAADASALAGTALITDPNDLNQPSARAEAVKFASKNSAAGSPVVLADGGPGNNILSQTNDITVGNWDTDRPPDDRYRAGELPINAVQVIARRDETAVSSPRRQVRVFIGQIFRIINADWTFMSARASAIASMPLRANGNLAMCLPSCTATYPSFDTSTRILETPPPPVSDSLQFVWSSLTAGPASASTVGDLICANSAFADACGKSIYMIPAGSAFPKFASVFLDPATPKTECIPIPGISCPPGGTGWWLIIPIVTACGSELTNGIPDLVVSYALIRVIRVCATSAAACPGRPALPSSISGCGPGDNTVTIDRLSCIPCPTSDTVLGLQPVLVK